MKNIKSSLLQEHREVSVWLYLGWRLQCCTTMALAVLTVGLLAGIYPEGHFDRVVKLTTSNFEETVTTTVDSGKTLFVRWIASEG